MMRLKNRNGQQQPRSLLDAITAVKPSSFSKDITPSLQIARGLVLIAPATPAWPREVLATCLRELSPPCSAKDWGRLKPRDSECMFTDSRATWLPTSLGKYQ